MSSASRTTPPDAAVAPARGPRHSLARPGGAQAGTWRQAWVAATWVWAALHVAYAIVTLVHRVIGAPPAGTSALDNWLQWDGWHYYRIAENGYTPGSQEPAFFPLFPLLGRAVDAVLPFGTLVALLVVSNVCAFFALALLHRLVATEAGPEVADRSVWLLGLFPTAYFLAAPYTHSLFLVLALGCLYAIRRQEWWVAGAVGALATATRSAGIMLLLPFALEYLRVRGFQLRRVRPDAAAIALVPAGLVAFAVYCWVRVGDPLAFSHAQSYWQKELSWPGAALWSAVGQLGRRSPIENYHLIADLGATLLSLALLVACVWGPWALRRDQWYLVAYAAPVVLLPMFFPIPGTNPLMGMSRYVLDVAVLFLVLGRAVARPPVERAYAVVALSLQVGFLFMYLRGDWTF